MLRDHDISQLPATREKVWTTFLSGGIMEHYMYQLLEYVCTTFLSLGIMTYHIYLLPENRSLLLSRVGR